MLTLRFALAALALTVTPAFANSEIESLPAGEVELADIASPAEIAAELLNAQDEVDMDVVPTASSPRLFVLVDKSEQLLRVYEDGNQTESWRVSTGTEQSKCAPSRCYTAHTPTGTFTVKRMAYTYTSKLWNARMDRAIFVVGGIALHATYGDNIAKLGQRASGGCVRQHPDNADKLFRLVKYYGAANTSIQIRE